MFVSYVDTVLTRSKFEKLGLHSFSDFVYLILCSIFTFFFIKKKKIKDSLSSTCFSRYMALPLEIL